MLEINNLTIKYEYFDDDIRFCPVLENINFTANKGELICITGHSGSGKSTLLKSICGIVPEIANAKIEGEILYNGKSILSNDIAERSYIVSTVFQNPKTQFYATETDDELAFALENHKVPRDEIKNRINKYTTLLGTEEFRGRDIFKLSGGEKQLVAITGAMCVENDICIFDEPSSSLDRNAIERFKKMLRRFKEMGKIVIIAEHRLFFLKEIMDELIVIENKKMYRYKKQDINEYIRKKHDLRCIDEISKAELNPKKVSLFESFTPNNPMLVWENLFLSYSKNVVIDMCGGFEKKVYFIIGENGVGKTSFIRSISRLNKYKRNIKLKGNIYYGEKKIKKASDYMSLILQEVDYQFFTESVEKEIQTVCTDIKRYTNVLERFGLIEKLDRHPQSLSGGEKQRLLIAMSIVSEKPIVILDEPTSGLCSKSMQEIIGYIKELESEGKLVIIVTHDYEFIKRCGGTVIEFIK